MKRKLLILFSAVVSCVVLAFGFTACDFGGDIGGENLKYTLSDDGTYYICSGIGTSTATDIVIANTYNNLPVSAIEYEAFKNCSQLTSVTIPNNVTAIYSYAFANCYSLKSIEIQSSVISISTFAFDYCNALRDVYINDITAWCNISFVGDVFVSGSNPFMGYNKLKKVRMGNSVTSIGFAAFYECSELTDVVLGDGITKIENSAFGECSSLTSINIPKSVITIGYAFAGCSGLMNIQFEGTKKEWNEIEKVSNWNYETGDYSVQCSDGKLDKEGNEIE